MKLKIDKLYIVSLDWSKETIDNILVEVMKIGLPDIIPYEVVGIDGRQLTTHHMNLMGIKAYDDWNLDNGNVVVNHDINPFWHRDVTMGEIGCTLSHVAIWEDAYKNGYENILVYEDDIVADNWTHGQSWERMDWEQLEKVKELNYDLFYLGRVLQNGFDGIKDTPIDDMICKPGYSYTTHGYMLSKSGIKKIVENHLPKFKSMMFVVDEFLPALYCDTPRTELNDIFTKDINAYALNKNVVEQSRNVIEGNSLTEPDDVASSYIANI